jgi:hypothetical protein
MTEAKKHNRLSALSKVLLNTISISVIGICFVFSGCTKYIDTSSASSSGSSSGSTTPVTVPVTGGGTGSTGSSGSTASGNVYIKFYGTLSDYNSISVSLNNSRVGTVSVYYPSGYVTGVDGINNIQLFYGSSTAAVLNINTPLVAGNYYSCFIYKVGYDFKVSIIVDNLTGLVNGFSGIRILDFRTQAYYPPLFLNTRVYYPGNAYELNQTGRHFLDQTSYSSYTNFTQVTAGNYNIVLYNDSTNFTIQKPATFVAAKFYSIILCTSTQDSVNASLYDIKIDIEQHN